jgi:hypothetical protein
MPKAPSCPRLGLVAVVALAPLARTNDNGARAASKTTQINGFTAERLIGERDMCMGCFIFNPSLA